MKFCWIVSDLLINQYKLMCGHVGYEKKEGRKQCIIIVDIIQ